MHLVEIFLPLTDSAALQFGEVREELTERFGGVTAFTQSPAEGFWKDGRDNVRHDKIVVVEVMARTLDREWWCLYRRSLEKRFDQESILVRMTPCDTL